MSGLRGTAFLATIHQAYPDMMKLLLVDSQDGTSSNYLLSRAAIHNILEKPWSKEHLILTVENLLKLYRSLKHLKEPQQISLHFGPIFELPLLLRKSMIMVGKFG
jgi:response regulator RpfG family c-di-GMP phosphodiesterase